jgi:hypothetical protein
VIPHLNVEGSVEHDGPGTEAGHASHDRRPQGPEPSPSPA